jgi:hypothetical protein
MTNRQAMPLTAEEMELIDLWLERPLQQRSVDQVPEYAKWVLEHRPALLPKGPDDACEYLMRLLADLAHEHPGPGAPEGPAG